MSEIKKNIEGSNEKWKRIFLFTLIFVFTYFILLTAVAPTRYDYIVGDIAESDIKAPRDIIDQEATAAKEKEAIEKLIPVRSLDDNIRNNANKNVNTFFYKLINLKSTEISEADKISQLKKIEEFKLTDIQYKALLALTPEQANEMQWVLIGALDGAYENNIREDSDEVSNNTITVKEAKSILYEDISDSGVEPVMQDLLTDMGYSQIKANYLIDKVRTEEKKTETLKNIKIEMIRKNQIIVREGAPITEKNIAMLMELGMMGEGVDNNYMLTYITLAIFLFFILYLQYNYLKKERNDLFVNTKLLSMICLLNIISLLLARGMNYISSFVIPLACTTLVMSLLLDSKVSLIINTLNMFIIAVVVGFNPQIILLSIISVIIGTITIRRINGRNDILYATVYLAVSAAIVTLASGMLLSNNIKLVISNTAFSVFGALISGVLAIGLLPFFEITFSVVTNMKLLELSNPNSPLLKRLLMEAPGTYHHSIMVGNLAEVAAEAVNANPILARVGAYYHDVGKLKRPIFFGENQMGRENPHNKIEPNLSSHVIISHAKDGLELGKEYKLPKIVQDIIVQHHGTTLVKYFYYTLKNSSDNPDDVKEDDFRYQGPIPSSKEAAIIMLADSVEAAVRSISEPTKDKIEAMVNNIIKDKLGANQLMDSDLTLRDLENIKKCFLRVLDGVYHQRIEYPTEKKVMGQ